MEDSFIQLVRLGIGHCVDAPINVFDWNYIYSLAEQQGLPAIVVDGIERLPENQRPPKDLLLEWIGEVLQGYEYRYKEYCCTIAEMAKFYNSHGYKMMVLKGYACSLDWPKPDHRPCGDIDIWLFGKQRDADTAIAREKGIDVDYSHHHHTVFQWGDFTVENHYNFINTHRHYSHRSLEQIFKELGLDNSHYVEVKGTSNDSATNVYLPSPNLHALFLIRHALNHFASIGINLRQVMDWAFYAEKHTNEIDWKWLKGVLEKYHMMDFYNCLNAICVEDLGFEANIFPNVQFNPDLKDKVFADMLSTKHEVEAGLKNKLKRWMNNRWKHKLCFKESLWGSFWSGVRSHLIKPSSI